MIQHHPQDELMLALAAGTMPPGQALIVSIHLETCVECRVRLHGLQVVGGALLEEAEPQLLQPDALVRTLERIDAPAPAPAPVSRPFEGPELPAGVRWPDSLRGCTISRWRWMGRGMRYARITLPHEKAGTLWALQLAAGKSLAKHTHSTAELTHVLCGSFDDGRSVFGPGDFDAADTDVWHQPVVHEGAVCVCLAYVEGNLCFESRLARLIGGWLGM